VATRLPDYLKVRRTPHGKTKAFVLARFARPMTTVGYGGAFGKACIRARISAGTEVHRTCHTFATHYLVVGAAVMREREPRRPAPAAASSHREAAAAARTASQTPACRALACGTTRRACSAAHRGQDRL
jgi:hypothetical protein